jgi:hypothetical protein
MTSPHSLHGIAIPFDELDVVSERRENEGAGGGFMSGLLGWFGQLGELLEDAINTTTRDANRRPNRELFPRQPFHDLQVKFTGVAARDVSSYFLQVRPVPLIPSSHTSITSRDGISIVWSKESWI